VGEHPLDAVVLTIKPLIVADRLGAVRFRRDAGANTPLLEIVADRIGIMGLVRDELLTPAPATRSACRSFRSLPLRQA
jgi:hypothetical protein